MTANRLEMLCTLKQESEEAQKFLLLSLANIQQTIIDTRAKIADLNARLNTYSDV